MSSVNALYISIKAHYSDKVKNALWDIMDEGAERKRVEEDKKTWIECWQSAIQQPFIDSFLFFFLYSKILPFAREMSGSCNKKKKRDMAMGRFYINSRFDKEIE